MDLSTANLVLLSTALTFSTISSYYDMKSGEIPDKFTLGLVVVALALRALFLTSLGFYYLLDGMITAALFFGIGALLFYSGAWGGGDAKLLTGIGAALGGFFPSFSILGGFHQIFPPLFGFFVSLAIVAIPYSLIYAFVLALRNKRVFSLIKKQLKKNVVLLFLLLVMSLLSLFLLQPKRLAFVLSLFSPPLMYILIIFVKSVEEIAMQRDVPVDRLMEGDIVAEDIIIGGKKIASKRNMDGLSKKEIREIKKAGLKRVRIRWGIRFAPAFPLAVLLSPFWSVLLQALL